MENEDNEPFLDAAKNGDIIKLLELINIGAQVTCRDEVKSTALHYACAGGHQNIVQYLLEQGADFDAVNDFNETPLHNASSKGHMEIVELLLQVHANIDIQTDDGWTALHLAAEKGHPDIVKLLVRRGANVSLKDKGGVAAARYTSNPEIIQEIATAQSNDDQDSARSSSTMLPQLNRTALDLSKGTSIQDGTDSSAQNNFSVVEQPEEPEPDEPKPASVPPECSDAISLLPESSLQEQYLDQHSQYTHQDDADGQQETGVMTRAKQQYEDRVVMETISLEEEEVLVSTVPSASAASVETNQCCVVS